MSSAAPPSAPAVNDTETELLPGVAFNEVGGDGTVAGVTGVTDTGDDSRPSPATLMALSLIEEVVPLVRLGMVTGEVVSVGDSAVHDPEST